MEKKKILVLMMSCRDSEIFQKEVDIAYQTWAKEIPENIDVMYYDGNWNQNIIEGIHIKCVTPDNLDFTFVKTINALQQVYNNYDWILRTNTSTWINLKLLRELVDNNILDESCTYGTDLYSLSEAKCPHPLDIYPRGNCILMSKGTVINLIMRSIYLINQNIVDDVAIGNIINCNYHLMRFNYVEKIKGLPHAWLRCAEREIPNGHAISTYYEQGSKELYKDCLTIQMKMYRRRGQEFENFKIMNEMMMGGYECDLEKVKKYIENPSIFLGSAIGYIPFDMWMKVPKEKLYEFEISHKAIDDKENPNYSPYLHNILHSTEI